MSLPDRLPPQALEAEQAVLGAALFSRTALEAMLAILSRGDFYTEAHRRIYSAAEEVNAEERPVDLLTLSTELRKRNELDQIGGMAYLTGLTASVPTAAHVEYYAAIVADKAFRRRLIDACGELTALAYEEAVDEAELEAAIEARILGLSRRAPLQTASAREVVLEAFDYLTGGARKQPGVPTGMRHLDWMTGGGWQGGDLIVVAGRSSMGKTAICLEWLRAAARADHAALYYSLEMPKRQLGVRLISAEAGVDVLPFLNEQYDEQAFRRVSAAADHLSTLSFQVEDEPNLPVIAIAGHARRTVRKQAVKLVIIDQLQTIPRDSRAENENVGYSRIVYALKALARSLEVPILLQCQLSRQNERRENKRPLLSDLRDSGAIENAADQVFALYRPDYYKRAQSGEQDNGRGPVELICLKNRTVGPVGTIRLEGNLALNRVWQPDDRYDEDDAPPENGREVAGRLPYGD